MPRSSSASRLVLRSVGLLALIALSSPAEGAPLWTAESDQTGSNFGNSVASAGDVNGDGYLDVIVGAPKYVNQMGIWGRAFAYYGSANGLAMTASWTEPAQSAMGAFGGTVATAGDVNGDGFSDVLIADPAGFGFDSIGHVYLYLGSSIGLESAPAWIGEGGPEADYGWSVATAGDVNGDGFSDVIVGERSFNYGEAEGRALVYHGSASGLGQSAAWTVEGGQPVARLGVCVSSAGDVNGDGYSDVIVGGHRYDNGESDEGRAYVYLGSAGGLAESAVWTAEGNQVEAFFGQSVASAGDVNGDGYSDVVVGAPLFDGVGINDGRAFVYYGSPSGVSPSAAWTIESGQADALLGGQVASAGDVNGDGYSDVIVGASGYHNGESSEGRAIIYHGLANGPPLSVAWSVESNQAGAAFGRSVACAGDLDGDGHSEVIVGANLFDNDQPNEGRAFVYDGASETVGVPSSDRAGRWLEPAVPNPFVNVTELTYALSVSGPVRLSVYDVSGREVALVTDRIEASGVHMAQWDGRDMLGSPVAAGLYLARLEFAGRVEVQKVVRIR